VAEEAVSDGHRTSSSQRTLAIGHAALALLETARERFRRHLEVHGIYLEADRLRALARIASGLAHDAIVEERRALDAGRCPTCGGHMPPTVIDPTPPHEDP
jgi:hypothetical protein